MAVDCPDNSTECLLRALIETVATQQDPWSSRSFIVSVFIGVAAFLISFVTVFQGLLAAGPGRIKASSDAIGSFASRSKGYISWREFAWRSKAFVPTITFEDLIRNLPKQHQDVKYGTAFYERVQGAATGATWLTLLKCIGLDEDIDVLFEKKLQVCATDHLPSDIQAPPAAIQLRCLAVLAAIADPSVVIEKGTRFPSIIGEISQISFREHPVLGTLAAYERYHTQVAEKEYWLTHQRGSRLERLKQRICNPNYGENIEYYYRYVPPFASLGRCTRLAVELAEGSIKMKWPFVDGWIREGPEYFSYRRNWNGCRMFEFHSEKAPRLIEGSVPAESAMASALTFAQTDYEIRPFPWKSSGMAGPASALGSCAPAQYQQLDGTALLECFKACGFVETDHTTSAESAIAFKSRGSWILPYEGEMLHRAMGDIGELAALVAGLISYFTGGSQPNTSPNTTRIASNRPSNQDRTELSFESISQAGFFLEFIDIFLAWHRTRAIEALNRLTERLRVRAAGTPSRRSSVASAAASQPVRLSTAQVPQLPPSAPQPVSTQTSSPLGSQRPASVQSHNSVASHSTPRTSTTGVVNAEAELLAFETLLIVRGLLFAAALHDGPDTSILWADDFRNSFVRVI